MAIVIVVGIVIAGEMFVLKKIEQYRRVWDKYSIRFIVVSLEMIIISGDGTKKIYANKSCGIIWNDKYRCHGNKNLLSWS